MAHITTCTQCGKLYEESSEEYANEPNRLCLACWRSQNAPVHETRTEENSEQT